MRLGVFGGAFDPPHKEHIKICLAAANELKLDKVVLLPSGRQPHKTSGTPASLRSEMIKAAIEPYPNLTVDDVELKYGNMAYASDILPIISEKYGEFVYIIGGDSLMKILSWHRPDLILGKYPIAVAARGGNVNTIRRESVRLHNEYGADIRILSYMPSDISSTKLRAGLMIDPSAEAYLPGGVADVIASKGLYREYLPLANKLKANISDKTYAHSVRTVYKAMEMNEYFGLPFDKVFLTAYLHDCMKGKEYESEYAEAVPAGAVGTPVMHAFQGAAAAERVYGITDREILSAIKYHTTGKAAMSNLEIIAFTADMVEDGRDFTGVKELRRLSAEDPMKGFLACIKQQYDYLKAQDKPMYPLTEECYKYYIKEQR